MVRTTQLASLGPTGFGKQINISPPSGPVVNIGNAPTVHKSSSLSQTATFTVSLSAPSADTIAVDYATHNGTALAGRDFLDTHATLTFAPGQTSQTIEVPLLSNPLSNPLSEQFSVVLSHLSDSGTAGAVVGVNVGFGSIDQLSLFTTGADTVNLKQVTTSQAAAVTSGADLYHSLGGADEVWLPPDGQALVPGISWDSSKVFSIGAAASVVPPGNDGATVHVGRSNDLIDGAYETNAAFGGAAGQRGNVVFTNGDTVEFSGSLSNYTIKELTGGYLEVRDNRGVDGTDILKDIAFLKFDGGDGRTAGPVLSPYPEGKCRLSQRLTLQLGFKAIFPLQ